MLLKNILNFNFNSNLCKNVKRFKHRQLLSRMFPSTDLSANHFQEDAKMKKVESVVGSLGYALMIKNKLIQNASSGTYHYLPSLTRSMNKLVQIIDKEMKDIGAQKIIMPCLAPQRLWEKSDRWQVMGSELFKVTDRSGSQHCLSPTHEEAVTSIVASESPVSYKRLPIKLYQVGKKFRDEMRPKHGLLRGREFEMKDLYTFDSSLDDASKTFEEVCTAYSNILTWLDVPFVTVDASTGAMGGTRSTEFHLLSDIGEDVLYRCHVCGKGVNKELLVEASRKKSVVDDVDDDKDEKMKCTNDGCAGAMHKHSGIEVAHAFVLDTKYSDAFKAKFIDSSGNKRSLVMGCYGIGVSRLLAATIEINSTKDRMKYCSLLAPYQICIIPQKEGYKSDVTWKLSESLYDKLTDSANLRDEVVIDDRLHLSIGQRVNQATAAGYPYIIALGKKALLEDSPQYELIDVYRGTTNFLSLEAIMQFAINVATINISL